MFGAVILTGGASSRMGEDKASALWLGVPAVDRVAALASRSGAAATVTVGRVSHGFSFVADVTPLGGPVGGIAAGVSSLRAEGCAFALVLAADAPTIRLEDIAPLIDEGSLGTHYEGYPLPMFVQITDVVENAPAGWSIRHLVVSCGLQEIPVPLGAELRLRGANTPAERDTLLQELAAFDA